MKELSYNCGYKDLPVHVIPQHVPDTEIDLPDCFKRTDINMTEF